MSSGGSSAPSQQTVTQVTIPQEIMPYATRLLGRAEALTDVNQVPYQTYAGQRVAGINPLQQQALMGTQELGPAGQIGQATNLARFAGLSATQAGGYNPMQQQQFYQAPSDVVSTERFGAPQMREYMSPYIQGVVEQQKQQALQDFARQIPGLQAQGIRAGARGGTREAILEAEARRGLQQQLGNIQATGLQNAYQQAAQQFGADRAAAMQAALANQQAALQKAQVGAQYGLGGAELAERSRQFGAGLGIQGIQQQLAASQALGQLGQSQFGQQMQALQAQQAAGSGLQQLEQQRLEQQYQDFLAQQRYPYTQLGFMSDIIRGIPATQAATSIYQAPPSMLGQVAGAGLGLAGLYRGMGG